MLILALESSAKPVSCAVYEQLDNSDGRLLGQYFQNNGFSHSRTLMPMVQALLKNLALKPGDIDLFAAAHGPGSFTGVRIGVSSVKGLAFGLDKPVCGVSALEAMAYQAQGTDALICPVIDARRSRVYNALFKYTDGTLVRLCEDRVISIEDLSADLTGYSIKRSNSSKKNEAVTFMPIGDGTDLVLSMHGNKNDGLFPVHPPPCIKYQSAYGVALAASHSKPISSVQLKPVYLRPSQAERIKGEV